MMKFPAETREFRRFMAVVNATALVCLLSVCGKEAPRERVEYIFGTVCSIRLQQGGSDDVYRRIFARLREIDDIFSVNKTGTVFDEINREAGARPVKVPAEALRVLDRALYFAELSGGKFDPTIGPLVKLWGIGLGGESVPPQDKIDEALSLINWRDVVIDSENGTAFLKKKNMALDLGGVVKGYAADEALAIVIDSGVKGALIDLGGNIIVYGEKRAKQSGKPWRIGIQDPFKERGEYIGVLEIEGGAVVTSGDYERFFEQDGLRYHHILSTETGYPVENDVVAVTVTQRVPPRGGIGGALDADALSTTLFALGAEDGFSLVRQMDGTGAVFALKDGKILVTPNLQNSFAAAAHADGY
ncbi:MAG: FAD:protein FMN transferase [Spirochaetaceae bacterium]|jgi:thiamine biosynthesis lipoprotein|nr:FAD:protein FMN transferase [Spirochaetaceae bacterium]